MASTYELRERNFWGSATTEWKRWCSLMAAPSWSAVKMLKRRTTLFTYAWTAEAREFRKRGHRAMLPPRTSVRLALGVVRGPVDEHAALGKARVHNELGEGEEEGVVHVACCMVRVGSVRSRPATGSTSSGHTCIVRHDYDDFLAVQLLGQVGENDAEVNLSLASVAAPLGHQPLPSQACERNAALAQLAG